jgi:uncharacterized protein (TIRG00374 family)
MKKKILKGFIITITLGAVVLLGLSIYADYRVLISSFARFPALYLFPVILLSIFNYIVRYFRWQYYLSHAGIYVGRKNSAYTFFSGLLMSVTPGKAGELLKSVILSEIEGVSISKSAPIVFAERLSDLSAVLVLAFLFSFAYEKAGTVIMIASALIVIFLVAVFTSERAEKLIMRVFLRFGFVRKFAESFEQLFSGIRSLLGVKPFLLGNLFGSLAWLFECAGFFIILRAFGENTVNLPLAVLIYTTSTLAGAISMLPGGLVFTEATMSGMLISAGVGKPEAVASTVLIRAATLWFGSFLGLLIFLTRKDILNLEQGSE